MIIKKGQLSALLFLLVGFLLANRVPVMTNGAMDYSQTVAIQEIDSVKYLHLRQFGEAIHAGVSYDPLLQNLTMNFMGHKIKMSAHSSFLLIDERAYNLYLPTRMEYDAMLVPLDSFLSVFHREVYDRIFFNQTLQRFEIELIFLNITGVQIQEKANGTILRIATTKTFKEDQINFWVHSAQTLYVTVAGGRLDSIYIAQSPVCGVVSDVVPIQLEHSVQIAFKLRKNIQTPELYQSTNPNEIIISLRTPITEDISKRLEHRKREWKFDCIVLDAGHGGKDPGAVGKHGLREKDVTLGVAKRLGKKIQDRLGVRVEYTRETDKFVELWRRAEIANEIGGDLFVSVHCNAAKNRKASGFETYFLRSGKSQDAIEVAQRENAVIQMEANEGHYERMDEEMRILSSMLQSGYMKESEELANLFQVELNKRLNTENRGVKQAGFYVLVGASMPNVLVEIGFISNRKEEKKMKTEAYLNDVAESLYQGVRQFIASYSVR
ncbi:MAG: N-acetylmuramoyl-L-alanine amidase [Candidatus Marinimicrobia bacterium]|nr:N-acetylmuramoyl-L-alanine amidase [Candidatus Neomarinimicrobiota bacterium]